MLEQGGRITGNGSYSIVAITFTKPFSSVCNLNVKHTSLPTSWFTGNGTTQYQAATDIVGSVVSGTFSNTGFSTQGHDTKLWYACGYCA